MSSFACKRRNDSIRHDTPGGTQISFGMMKRFMSGHRHHIEEK
jgi:hypothetical protein